MPRYKPCDQGRQFVALDLSEQLRAGSFEYALNYLIDHELDLFEVEARYKNEEQGAVAYDPRVLLKIVLLAYSRGIISSRGMEASLLSRRAVHGDLGQSSAALQHVVELREQPRPDDPTNGFFDSFVRRQGGCDGMLAAAEFGRGGEL